jgi:hypothetical protein
VGQKISTKTIDKSKDDAVKWNLYMFVLKLINPVEHKSITSLFETENYN